MAIRWVAVVVATVLGLSMATVPAGYATPNGPNGSPPTQRTGSATGSGHRVSSAATSTRLTAPARSAARPSGAVPDSRPVPAVTGNARQHPATVIDPKVTRGPAAHGYDPRTSVEIPADRTATTRTFRNQDGTHTVRLYPGQANVRQPDGSWSPVDLALAPTGHGLAPKNAPHRVTFTPNADSGTLATVDVDAHHSLSFGLAGAAAATAVPHGDTATYRGVHAGTDLTLTATRSGVQENLVLAGRSAATSYSYPLTPTGLTPALDTTTGGVRLTDAAGATLATIPPGLMTDAKGATSTAVHYTLLHPATGWQLRVDLDHGWLTDPARAYPVTVDPSVTIQTDTDDTYVRSGLGDESSAADLQIGQTGNGIARSYLHFGGLASTLAGKYVDGASLDVYNIESASCQATPVTLFNVSSPWSGSGLRWPGASVNKAYQTRSFAHGGPSCGPAWEALAIDPNDVTAWTHGSTFDGLGLRAADESSTSGFKRFASADSANSPYLDVTYADQGAAYSVSELLLPTANTQGRLTVKVTNQGSSAWPSGGGYTFGFTVLKGGSAVYTSPHYAPSGGVNPMATTTWQLPIPAITPAAYTIQMTMYNPSGQDFHPAYGVPYGTMPMTVQNVPPTVNYEQPGDGGNVGSLTPTLYAEGVDPDNWPGGPLKYDFRVCTDPSSSFTHCMPDSGWTGQTWTPPSGALRWSQTYYWWVQTNDNAQAGPWVGPLQLTTSVPQPEITGHLAGSPDSTVGPGLDAQIGNYSTQVTDASVNTVGPDLTITRTYNSLDPRTNTAFGVGWSSRIDTRMTTPAQEPDGNVVVTLPTGRQVRFGQNADGTFAPPDGENLELVYSTSTGVYTMRDGSGNQWLFDAQGRLTTVKDADGLAETLAYDGYDRVTSITNQTSKRSLTFTWPAGGGGHVLSVQANGGPQWTYTYSGDQLTAVCAPGPAPNCTHYTYGTGSHYRSSVLDDNPRAYYRLDESSGSTPAANVTARTPGADGGQYHGVVLGVPGALAGTGDTAGVFDGNSSYVTLPDKLVSPSMSPSVELWFRTTAGGVLLSYQNGNAFPDTSGNLWTPLLYVGTDGYLYGGFSVPSPNGDRQAVSQSTVNDNQWHHAVLSASINTQTLYLDGQAQDTVRGTIDHQQEIHLTVGAGRGDGWPATNGGSFYFNGSIDELAVYLHPLGPLAVQDHHDAAAQTTELTQVTLPQDDRLFAKLTYDDNTDRVATLLDHQGRTWSLGAPAVNNSTRTVVLHGPYPDWTYTFDVDHAGRLVSTTHNDATTSYDYDSAGFVRSITDADNHTTSYTTDARGNVLSRTTCRSAGSCDTSYHTYFLDTADPLDPRNDELLTSSDARSSGPDDTTYRVGYTYDATGRLLSTSYPASSGAAASTATQTYSAGTEQAIGGGSVPAGLLLTSTGRRGQVTTYGYDSAGDLRQVVAPTGLHTDYTYDSLGRAVTVKSANTGDVAYGTTTYAYTDRSQVASVTGPAVPNPVTGITHQQVASYGYDGDGNTTQIAVSDTTGAVSGGDAARTTRYTFDGHDRLTGVAYPDGGTEQIGYSADGEQISTTDQNNVTWTDQTDDEGRLLARTVQGTGADPQDPSATSLALEYRSYDPAGRLASVTDAMGRRTTYGYYDDNQLATVTAAGVHGDGTNVQLDQRVYDAAGDLTQDTQAGGAVSTYTYDAAGYVSSQTLDPNGLRRTLTYQRDADGNATQAGETGAATPGRTEMSTFTYGPDDQLTQENDEQSPGTFLSVSYQYDERGLLHQYTDRNRNASTYEYDANGNLTRTTGPAIDTWVDGTEHPNVAPIWITGYDTYGEATDQQDPLGAVTTTAYDGMGRPTTTTLPAYTPPGKSPITATETTTYDHVGNALTVTDPLGRQTATTYDPYGDPLTLTEPQVGGTPSVTTFGYDRDGETLSATNPVGAQTRYTYDDLGRQVTQTAVERTPALTSYYTTTVAYDDAGNPLRVTTPAGNTTVSTFDAAGELTSSTDPTNRVTSYGHDNAGRVASTTDPSGLVTGYAYDLAGRMTGSSQSRDGSTLRSQTFDHDPNGNLTSFTSAAGRVSTFGYDAMGDQVKRVDDVDSATSITTTLGYDAAGDQTRLVDGNGHATDYTYTPWRLPESTVEPATAQDPNQRTWTTGYDAAGQPTTAQLPGGVTRAYTFDAQGRLTAEAGSGADAATTDRHLGYDAAGRLTTVNTPGGDTTYGYDDRGDLVQAQGGSGNASYTYRPDGLLASRTDATGTANFGYDTAGRLTSMTDPLSGRTVNYEYNPGGQVGGATDSASSTVSRNYTYDALERLTGDQVTQTVDVGVPPRVLLGATYGYDADNNVTSKTTTQSNTSTANTYGYDGASRLTSWTVGGATVHYTWDAAGNRTAAGNTTYTYNERNQLLSDGTSTYAYTPRGTLASVTTGGSTSAVTYDAFDRKVSDQNTTYGYDGLNRVATRGGQSFGYDDLTDNVVSDGSQLVSREPDGTPFADRTSGTTGGQWVYADQHGDVTGAYLSSTVAGSRSFDPFGAVTSASGGQPAVGYQGDWTDPSTGKVDMTARWYDPGTATFTSRDDIAPQQSTSSAADRYAYADGNPVSVSDPSGLDPAICLAAYSSDDQCNLLSMPWGSGDKVNRGLQHLPSSGASSGGGGSDAGSGDWSGGGDQTSYSPPPPPQWLRNAMTAQQHPAPGRTVTPRPPRTPSNTPHTKVINPGPAEVAAATKVTQDGDNAPTEGIGGTQPTAPPCVSLVMTGGASDCQQGAQPAPTPTPLPTPLPLPQPGPQPMPAPACDNGPSIQPIPLGGNGTVEPLVAGQNGDGPSIQPLPPYLHDNCGGGSGRGPQQPSHGTSPLPKGFKLKLPKINWVNLLDHFFLQVQFCQIICITETYQGTWISISIGGPALSASIQAGVSSARPDQTKPLSGSACVNAGPEGGLIGCLTGGQQTNGHPYVSVSGGPEVGVSPPGPTASVNYTIYQYNWLTKKGYCYAQWICGMMPGH